MYKTHTCGELRISHCDESVVLAGWVNVRRDHGGLVFLDLRDRYGETQVVVDADQHPEAHAVASQIRPEFVIRVAGVVRTRPEGTANEAHATGEIELAGKTVTILNRAETPPFYISDEGDETDEALRLEYRYLDLRRPRMLDNLRLRHAIISDIRGFLAEQDFIEVETPHLLKSTPEGARDFVVPSRLQQGSFYALPQSPQQLKQLLMVSGLDRYFQIARCFRDEDLRSDRQPEFTQLDLEMSFVEPEDIRNLIENLIILLAQKHQSRRIQQTPFPILTFKECMDRFGTDRPDLRFGVELFDATAVLQNCEFKVFSSAIAGGAVVKGLVYPNGAQLSRREIDRLTDIAKQGGALGLAWLGLSHEVKSAADITDETFRSPIARHLTAQELADLIAISGAKAGDMILLVAQLEVIAAAALHLLRTEIGKSAQLVDPDVFAFCWVTDFPLLEMDLEAGRWTAVHHPFTSARDQDWDQLEEDPGSVLAKAYDLVLNGWEIGGGSIRIHDPERQTRIFRVLNLPGEQIEREFGHLLKAFRFGAPPHGGIAMGLDRIVALWAGSTNIRDVIAFPKTATGADLLFECPAPLNADQLLELGIDVAV